MRLASILTLVLLSMAVAQENNHCPTDQFLAGYCDAGGFNEENPCPYGQIPQHDPRACVDPPPADHYTQSPCWGYQKMLTMVDDVQGCTFWINGEQIGWAKYGKAHVFSRKFSRACRGRLVNDCLAADVNKDIRKRWGLEYASTISPS